jgi:putative N6-adenine-specific DNA methylase
LTSTDTYFVTCAPGLEPTLHAEARALKLGRLERQVGGVRFEGTLADAWRANLWLRTAVRVLLRVARFEARDGDQLYRGAQSVDWSRFLRPDGSFVVDAQATESALDHTLFVAQRVKDAIADGFRASSGTRPSVSKDDADLGVHVHLFRDRCTLSVDTSGESLHKRGWRRYQGRAPLSETLAAALVLESGWDRRSPLVDPFCGSGTILIEAALIAANAPPGAFRDRFGFSHWPGHDESSWRALVARAREEARVPRKLVLRGSDASAEAIEGARENLESSGCSGRIELEVARAEDFVPLRGWNAWIVSNPPYGERVGTERDLAAIYRGLGDTLRERCAGYHAALLSGNPQLTRALRVTPQRVLSWKNGAIDCQCLLFDFS